MEDLTQDIHEWTIFKKKLSAIEKSVMDLKGLAPDSDIEYRLSGIIDAIDDVMDPITNKIEIMEDEQAEIEAEREDRMYGSFYEQNRLRMRDVI